MKRVNARTAPAGIGGWLLVLCLLLLIGHPAAVGLAVSRAVDSIATVGVSLALLIAARIIGGAFGVGAGIALLKRRSIGLAMAKAALVVSAILDVFVLTTPVFPSSRAPGETPLLLVATIAYYGTWVAYLLRSRRVSETFRDR